MRLTDTLPGSPAAGDPDDDLSAWDVTQTLARALHVREGDLEDTLTAVLHAAVEALEPATAAGVNLYVRGRFEPQAVCGEPPHELDEWQREHGVGPCIEASATQSTVRVDDTATDPRWSGFGAAAGRLGVGSMLCVPLWVDDTRLGSVSLYAATPAAFTARHEAVAAVVATQAALAVGGALRTRQLRVMAGNRDLIGQAKGILMERHKITADQAFDLLRVASQESNRKLVAVADALVATGALG